MKKSTVKKLQKIIPEGGGYDVQLSHNVSGKQGVQGATAMVTIFSGKKGESKASEVLKRVTVMGEGDTILTAQQVALNNAVTLLGG